MSGDRQVRMLNLATARPAARGGMELYFMHGGIEYVYPLSPREGWRIAFSIFEWVRGLLVFSEPSEPAAAEHARRIGEG